MLTKLSNYSKSIKYYNLFIYLTIGLSSVTLLGWIFNIEILKSWDVDGKWLKMPVISALVFIIASVSLKLSIDNKFKSLSYYLPLLIFGIAIFSYLNYYYFNDYSNVAVYDLSIFVVQPLTVLAFSLIGIDLLLISFKNKKFQLIIEIIASIGLLLNFIFFITMLFGIKSIGNIIFFPKVSFQGTICLILISFSILSSSPNKILLSVYNYNSNAARVGTMQMNLIIILIVFFGWFRLSIERAGYINTEVGLGIMICFFILICFFVIRKGISVIDRKEKEKEKEFALKSESEEKFKDTLERISDGFISLDTNWCYTFINKIAGETMGRNPKQMIGKNIWKEFPETIGEAFYVNCFKAIETQEYQYMGEYYPPYNKWFQSSFYPSKNGLSVFFQDITEKNNREKEIIKSNQRFQLLSKATNDALWELNVETGEIWGNEVHQKLFGRTILDPVPTEAEWLNRVHTDDRERVEKMQNEMLRAVDNFYSCEYSFLNSKGDYINILDRAFVEKNEKGNPLRIVGNMMDITKIKNFEKSLAESKNHLKSILDSAPNCIKLLNSKGELLEMNGRGLDMIEASNIEILLNKPINSLIKEEYKASFSDMIKTVYKGESAKLQFEIIALKGTHKWFETSSVPLYNDQGDITSLLGVTTDITESKKYENEIIKANTRFNLITKATNDALWEANFITGELWGNETHQNLYGLTINDPVPSEVEWLQRIHPEERDHVYQNLQKSLSLNNNIFINEYRFLNSKNVYINIFSRAYIERDNNNKVVRILGAMMDVTSQKENSKKIAESYQSIRKLTDHLQKIREEERTHIAREIHDEFGQQLAALKMDAFWLNKNVDATKESRQNKSSEVLSLINEMIKTVRKISFDLRPKSLDDLGLGKAFEQFVKEFELKSEIKINLEIPSEEPIINVNIKNALYRIFQESFTNISRHSKATEVDVSYTINHDKITLEITDHGVGFDVQNLENNTLGIVGMRERIEILNGEFSITSTKEIGTTLNILVPIKE